MQRRLRLSYPCVAGTRWPSWARQEVIKAGGRENTAFRGRFVKIIFMPSEIKIEKKNWNRNLFFLSFMITLHSCVLSFQNGYFPLAYVRELDDDWSAMKAKRRMQDLQSPLCCYVCNHVTKQYRPKGFIFPYTITASTVQVGDNSYCNLLYPIDQLPK